MESGRFDSPEPVNVDRDSLPQISSGIVVRQLAFEEWDRLNGCPALPVDPSTGLTFIPDPFKSIVVIAELNGVIVGFWLATAEFVHCDGFWIDPEHQKKSTLPLRIFEEMRQILDRNRVPMAFCWVDQQIVADYVARLGMTLLPVQTWRFEPSHVPEINFRREVGPTE